LILAHQISVLLFSDHRLRSAHPGHPASGGTAAIIPNHRKTDNRHRSLLIVASQVIAHWSASAQIMVLAHLGIEPLGFLCCAYAHRQGRALAVALCGDGKFIHPNQAEQKWGYVFGPILCSSPAITSSATPKDPGPRGSEIVFRLGSA
jgi:hypothetical protein